jgi:hemolysin activation/secretion protein
MIYLRNHLHFLYAALIFCAVFLNLTHDVFSQSVPSSADAGRINEYLTRPTPLTPSSSDVSMSPAKNAVTSPTEASKIQFVLKGVRIEGNTVFDQEDLKEIYEPYINQTVTLDIAWHMAGQLTERYHQRGFFLSRAYVPAQEITNGIVTLGAVEGYIGQVSYKPHHNDSKHIPQMIKELEKLRPLTSEQLESFMLRLNDLPKKTFQGIILPESSADEGAVKLRLKPSKKSAQTIIGMDNYGSRFLGPYQASATYQRSLLQDQLTTFHALASIPTEELAYGAVNHGIFLSPDWTMELNGSYVNAEPGYRLKSSEVQSTALEASIGLKYQPIRQRRENLVIGAELGGKNTEGDIFSDIPLTRDRIRTVKLSFDYNNEDNWLGYNSFQFDINRGLSLFGASEKGLPNLSRAEATPNFTAYSVSLTREQMLSSVWSVRADVSGQFSSSPLYSSEEFGYGGQRFGRAYDPSEITGDSGIAGALEVNYYGMTPYQSIRSIPFAFYDMGKTWNEDTNSENYSASSAGLGIKLSNESGLSGTLGIAWPLTRRIENPIYGNGKNPRILGQLSYRF